MSELQSNPILLLILAVIIVLILNLIGAVLRLARRVLLVLSVLLTVWPMAMHSGNIDQFRDLVARLQVFLSAYLR